MTTIGNYTTQEMRNIILKFYPGGYTPRTFGNVVLNWESRTTYSSSSDLAVAINVMGLYRDTTYTYLKYCEEYVVGYSQYGVQILKGRCYYGGIRDLGFFIEGIEKIIYHETKNLGMFIGRVFTEDFPASIFGENPANLLAYVNVFQTDYKDLPINIHGWVEKYLDIYIKGLTGVDLPISITSVPPVDLPIYLNVWPMKSLPINIYGWDQRDLQAYFYAIQQSNLPINIASEPAKDLNVILKGWVREAYSDLGAYIRGFGYEDLPVIIRATYLKDLPMYVYGVPSQNLPIYIHGWDELNLGAIINGIYGKYDLRAIINPTNNYKELPIYIKAVTGLATPSDLRIYVDGKYASDLTASIFGISAIDLPIYLNCLGQTANLSITIYPKTIRLSSIVSVITMEHSDLSMVINPSCIWSASSNLAAYARAIYKTELGMVIVGKKYETVTRNLGVKIGYMNTYSFINKLPINLSIATESYRFIDKLPFYLKIFRESVGLSTYINGIYRSEDLPVYIYGSNLTPHYFANVKNKQKVCHFTHAGAVEWFEMVEISFKSIVDDYHYSKTGSRAWKADKLDRWILDVKSYIPMNVKLDTKRKLHRLKYIYDLTDFESIDEAMKYAIDFVTDYPERDLTTYINPSGGWVNLQSRINTRRTIQEHNNLNLEVTGIGYGDVVVGTDTDLEII